MLIQEMTVDECRAELAEKDFGRLACVHADQPYVVPVYFSYDGQHLYGVTSLGQKIEWMRSNPHVCLEVDVRTSHYEWVSIIVYGRYEELPDTPEYQRLRTYALEVLQKRSLWWEPACIPVDQADQRPPVLYRISIAQMTGRRATPDAVDAMGAGAAEISVRQ